MKKITAALLLMVSLQATAQDLILKKNGEELKAKVIELTSTDIKYKAEDNPEGPLYNLPKAEVFKIKYLNGKSDFFGAADAKESIATIAPSTTTNSYKYDSLMKKYKEHRAGGFIGCIAGPLFIAAGGTMVILGINETTSSLQGLLIGTGNNWDIIDISCHKIVGAYLADKNRAILYKLARSKQMWERRIAIISTAYFIDKNDLEDTFKIGQNYYPTQLSLEKDDQILNSSLIEELLESDDALYKHDRIDHAIWLLIMKDILPEGQYLVSL